MKNHHYNLNLYHYLKTSLTKLELSIWLHTIAQSLVSVFIPIILLKSGFTVSNVILFLLIFNLFDVPLNFVARKLIIKFGAIKTIIIGDIAVICYFALLGFTQFNWIILILMAFTAAVYDSFYWVAHWFVFNECIIASKEPGRNISSVMFIRSLGSLFAPVVGLFFLIFVNKQYLIILGILFFILSLFPLYKIQNKMIKPKKEPALRLFLKAEQNKLNFLSNAFFAIHNEIEHIILPLAVFIIFASITSVGSLAIIAAVVSIVFTLVIGRVADKFNKILLIIIGAILIGAVWIIRIEIPLLNTFYITALITGFLAATIIIPLDSNLIEIGKRDGILNASTYRNVAHMSSNVLTYTILYISLEVFQVSFIIAAIGMFLLAMINSAFLLFKPNNNNTQT